MLTDAERRQILAHQIDRLDRQIERLKRLEARFAWIRLAIFLAGLGGCTIALIVQSPAAARWVFLVSALIFGGVVVYHRHLDRLIAGFEIYAIIRRHQHARLGPDWDAIPLPPNSAMRSSLDVDLDLSGPRSLFHLLGLAVSQEGSARLRGWLTQPEPDPLQIHLRQGLVAELAGLPRFCDRLLLNLRRVSKDLLHGERLTRWLDAPVPTRRLKFLLALGSLAAFVNLSLFYLNLVGRFPPYWVLTFGLTFAFYNFNAALIREFLDSVVDLDRELEKFQVLLRHLENFPLAGRPHLQRKLAPFRDPASLPSALIRRIKWVTAGVGLRANPIIGFLINLLVPWDYLFALLAGGLRQQAGQKLPVWLDTWYDLEALLSLGDFAHLHPDFNFPEVDAQVEPVLEAVSLSHPLLPSETRQANDFTIRSLGEVFILTGSNMAGKSTFLKTLGANLCLAYAGAPVCAQSLKMRPFRLATCMQISDSLVDGWSYFFAEVQCLKNLLAALNSDHSLPLLYLIDELFRGTNNRERLIGSRAYIRELIGTSGAGLIATHDLELAGLASSSPLVRNYHFRDRVEGERLVFDYHIRPGPCPSTNALRIMQMQGLPVSPEAAMPQPPEAHSSDPMQAEQHNSADPTDQQNLLSDHSKKN